MTRSTFGPADCRFFDFAYALEARPNHLTRRDKFRIITKRPGNETLKKSQNEREKQSEIARKSGPNRLDK
jgi:hypothetical protein